MSINYSNFPVTDDLEKDINMYGYVCDGHIRSLGLKIEAKRGTAVPAEPTHQVTRLHNAQIAELENRQLFWAEQKVAADMEYLLEAAGQDPEWGMRHQSLRAEAVRFGRLIHTREFESYVAEAFAPKDYARQP